MKIITIIFFLCFNLFAEQTIVEKCDSGDIESCYQIGINYEELEKYPQAIKYFDLASKGGHSNAQFKLGNIYYEGKKATRNIDEAFHYYKLSSRWNKDASFKVAQMYLKGDGIKIDFKKALEYFIKANEQGHLDTEYYIGLIYASSSTDLNLNYKEAIKWWKISVEKKDERAQYNLGILYHNGNGTKKDFEKAFELYNDSIANGNNSAYYNIGLMYYKGEGRKVDKIKAYENWKLSKQYGNDLAKHNIEILCKEEPDVCKDEDKKINKKEKELEIE